MTLAFAERPFTPAVKAAQSRYGSRQVNRRLEDAVDRQDELAADERNFIASRDGFFQATVGESGWPYVQFRGGPPGFLKVIDAKTLASRTSGATSSTSASVTSTPTDASR